MNGNTDIDVKLARDVLATVVQAYCRIIMAAMPDTRKVLRLSQNLRGFVQRHRRVQIKFWARARREALETNAGLRRRVHFDLGGTVAMVKWERRRREARVLIKARLARADNNGSRPIFDEPAKPRNSTLRMPWTPRTDRTKGYRLATIPTGVRRVVKHRKIKTRIVKPSSVIIDRPIEVTSDELRPNHYFVQGFTPIRNIKSSSLGHGPPIDRPPIH